MRQRGDINDVRVARTFSFKKMAKKFFKTSLKRLKESPEADKNNSDDNKFCK
jgi:hypothetical protein